LQLLIIYLINSSVHIYQLKNKAHNFSTSVEALWN